MKVHPLYLNGEFVNGTESIDVFDPATEELIGRMSVIGRAETAIAIDRARDSFPSWRETTAKERGQFLNRIADEMEKRSGAIAGTLTRENGKPLAQSKAEASMAIDHLRWFAEEGKRNYGRLVPHWKDSKRHLVIKSPIGVVGAISPWNFPLMLSVRKVAPALAAGCPVILKPASATPLCVVQFAECVHAAGLPKGVFQLIQGPASELAAELLENPACRKITFTGSTEVGKKLIRAAADQVKPLSLELGGQGPAIVFDDANLDQAVEGVIGAKFRNTGQSCIAANRIYVQRGIYERFAKAFTERVRSMKVGGGLEPDVEIGPLIDEAALTKAQDHVDDAVRRGARLLRGGRRLENRKGFFYEPTVIVDVPDDALCSREETFAPIAPIFPFETEDEAIRRANASDYGLSAYAFTSDLSRTFRLMEALEAGTIGINDGIPTATQCPFGGAKMSGWGRELGAEGLDAFLETKHVSIGL